MRISRLVVGALVACSLAGAPASLRADPCPDPAAVVSQFLHLAPPQAQAFAQLLQVRQAAMAPLLQQIAVREQRIRELVAAGGDPAEIGTLMLQVHQLQQAVAGVQGQFLGGLSSLLTDEQRQIWEQVRLAARLQPVLPAFQALQLL
jgi:hypothetical protein